MFGYIKDPEDSRDYNAKILVPTAMALPKSFRVDKFPMIYNQGQTSKCTAFAAAGVKTDEEYIQAGKRLTFDAAWLYDQCKKIDGIPDQPGTYPRIACKIMTKQMKLVNKNPDEQYRIAAYYRVDPDSTIEEVQQIIYQWGSLLFGCNWYNSWFSMFFKRTFPKPDRITGGHCTRVIGWNPDGMEDANSWGKFMWGWLGVATMPYEYFLAALREGDCWKVVDFTGAMAPAESTKFALAAI